MTDEPILVIFRRITSPGTFSAKVCFDIFIKIWLIFYERKQAYGVQNGVLIKVIPVRLECFHIAYLVFRASVAPLVAPQFL